MSTGRAGAEGLAISLVGDKDARLLADIAKLTRQELQSETLPEEALRLPRSDRGERGERRSSSYARSAGERDDSRRRASSFDADVAGSEGRERRDDRYRRVTKVADPFFERPYEAQSAQETPAWDAAEPRRSARTGQSANIRPKRKQAALFRPNQTPNNGAESV